VPELPDITFAKSHIIKDRAHDLRSFRGVKLQANFEK